MGIPFIHLIDTPIGNYVYDVNKNQIIEIDIDMYNALKNMLNGDMNVDEDKVLLWQSYGYFSSNHSNISKHPDTDYIEYYVKSHLSALTLQVTQQCNFRCEYCIYSGNYMDRKHSSLIMTKEMAKSGIDYLLSHSMDNNNIYLGFYGGEPLCEFDLIKWSIDYTNKKVENKKVYYNITTNASLLTEDMINYFVSNNVMMLISLDGPKDIHDAKRKFASDGSGTFDTVIDNIRFIHDKYPKYYEENVGFNVVLHGDKYNDIKNFFNNNQLFCNNSIISTFITDNYCLKDNEIEDIVIAEKKYDLFMKMLYGSKGIDEKNSSRLIDSEFYKIGSIEEYLNERTCLPDSCHRGGGCVPGVHKLFLSANGKFYPCERVSEASDVCCIGDIDKGLDEAKIRQLLNLERYTSEECKKCWAASFCTICLAGLENEEQISSEKILERCDAVRNSTELWMKNYCVLKKIGVNLDNSKDKYGDLSSANNLMEAIANDDDYKLYNIDIPVCFIGESIEGLNISSDLTYIFDLLTRKGYKVKIINCEILYEIVKKIKEKNGFSKCEYVSAINHYIKMICDMDDIDIVLINIPGGIERSLNGVNNMYGIWYYIMSIAAAPDCTILKLPFDEYNNSDIELYRDMAKQKFSIDIDFFIIGKSKLCFDYTETDKENNFLSIDDIKVKSMIDSISIDCCYCEKDNLGMMKLTDELIKLLESFGNMGGMLL